MREGKSERERVSVRKRESMCARERGRERDGETGRELSRLFLSSICPF